MYLKRNRNHKILLGVMFEFDLFREEVLKDYKSKLDNNQLSNKLENPSPANLRDYAYKLYIDGLKKEDLIIFEDFFNSSLQNNELEKVIKRVDLGRLKSIQNFINGTTNSPDELIVKMLSILIDFERRPFFEWRKADNQILGISNNDQIIKNNKNDNLDIQQTEEYNTKIAIEDNFSSTVIPRNKNRNLFAATIGGLSLLSIGFFTSKYLDNNNCMYWNGERYIQIDCESKSLGKEIILSNDDKINLFKKNTRPDTLKESDLGQIWYSKIKNQVEFFTAPGNHPIKKHIQLKPATWYMIEKYGLNKKE